MGDNYTQEKSKFNPKVLVGSLVLTFALVLGGVIYAFNSGSNTGSYTDKEYASAVKYEIQQYVADYFATEEVEEYLTAENLQEITDIILVSLDEAGVFDTIDKQELEETIYNELLARLEAKLLEQETKIRAIEIEIERLAAGKELTPAQKADIDILLQEYYDSEHKNIDATVEKIYNIINQNKESATESLTATEERLLKIIMDNLKTVTEERTKLKTEIITRIEGLESLQQDDKVEVLNLINASRIENANSLADVEKRLTDALAKQYDENTAEFKAIRELIKEATAEAVAEAEKMTEGLRSELLAELSKISDEHTADKEELSNLINKVNADSISSMASLETVLVNQIVQLKAETDSKFANVHSIIDELRTTTETKTEQLKVDLLDLVDQIEFAHAEDKAELIDLITTVDAENKASIDALENALATYNAEVENKFASMQDAIDTYKSDLEGAIVQCKDDLTGSIEELAGLHNADKTQLENAINALELKTVGDLNALELQLSNALDAQKVDTDREFIAVRETIENLRTESSNGINAMRQEMLTTLESQQNIHERDKTELVDLINAVDVNSQASITALDQKLTEMLETQDIETKETIQQLSDRVNTFKSDLETAIAECQSQLSQDITNLVGVHEQDKQALEQAIADLDAKTVDSINNLDTKFTDIIDSFKTDVEDGFEEVNNALTQLREDTEANTLTMKNELTLLVSALEGVHEADKQELIEAIKAVDTKSTLGLTNLENKLTQMLGEHKDEAAQQLSEMLALITNTKQELETKINDTRTEILGIIDGISDTHAADKEELKSLISAGDLANAEAINALSEEFNQKFEEYSTQNTEAFAEVNRLLAELRSDTEANLDTLRDYVDNTVKVDLMNRIETAEQALSQSIQEVSDDLGAQVVRFDGLLATQKTELLDKLREISDQKDANLQTAKEELTEYVDTEVRETKEAIDADIAQLKVDTTASIDQTRADLVSQIQQNATDDVTRQNTLISMLENLEDEHLRDTESLQDALSAQNEAQTQALEDAVNTLQLSLNNHAQRLTALEADVQNIKEVQMVQLKTDLQSEIAALGTLHANDKAEILTTINDVITNHDGSLAELKTVLEKQITDANTANNEALNEFIEKLYGGASDTVTIASLLQGIQDSKDMTEAYKIALQTTITEKFDAVSASITAVETALANEVNNRTAAINNAVSAINGTIDDLAIRVTALETRLDTLEDVTLVDLETRLNYAITSNTNLLNTTKTELYSYVNSELADRDQTIGDLESSLTTKINEEAAKTATALNDAIAELKGGSGSTITLKDLQDQIAANQTADDATKDALMELVNNNADAITANGQSITAVQTLLTTKVTELATQINQTKTELQTNINNVATRVTTLETKVADLTNNQIATLRSDLNDLVESAALTQQEVDTLETYVDTELAKRDTSIANLQTSLQAQITQASNANTTALNNFITSLYGGANQSVTIKQLQDVISANTTLANNHKATLEAYVDSKHADALAEINDLRDYVNAQLAADVSELNTKITALETSVSNLTSQFNTFKLQQNATNTSLQSQINDLSGLVDAKVWYNAADGHIYGSDKAGTDVKKLDFAQ